MKDTRKLMSMKELKKLLDKYGDYSIYQNGLIKYFQKYKFSDECADYYLERLARKNYGSNKEPTIFLKNQKEISQKIVEKYFHLFYLKAYVYKTYQFSEEFLANHLDGISFEYIAKYQNISKMFIYKHSDIFINRPYLLDILKERGII